MNKTLFVDELDRLLKIIKFKLIHNKNEKEFELYLDTISTVVPVDRTYSLKETDLPLLENETKNE
jgi:hypothetical protein